MKTRNQVLTFLFCLFSMSIFAQDLHYSQFYHSPININPALTGIFNGDKRVSVSLRDQWRAVPVPWFTISAGYDQKIYPRKDKPSFFGVGGLINYDQQGDSRMTLANLNLSGSYNYLINKKNIITLGVLGGFAARGYNTDDLTWDKQWNGLSYDPSSGSGEAIPLQRVNILETAAGLNYRFQVSSRTKFDIGGGAFHLLEPKVSYFENSIELPRRFSGYVIAGIKLTERLDFNLDGLYQYQDPYSELLFGGYLTFYLGTKRGKMTSLQLGAGYRTSEALYPKIAIRFNEFFVAASYDIDMSPFSQHTNGRGGPEIHFQYIITNVKPMGAFKICPIF